tara:strand:- start:148 stop:873 length:726 start_codon:yes stop_codon:yes gene_type:complete
MNPYLQAAYNAGATQAVTDWSEKTAGAFLGAARKLLPVVGGAGVGGMSGAIAGDLGGGESWRDQYSGVDRRNRIMRGALYGALTGAGLSGAAGLRNALSATKGLGSGRAALLSAVPAAGVGMLGGLNAQEENEQRDVIDVAMERLRGNDPRDLSPIALLRRKALQASDALPATGEEAGQVWDENTDALMRYIGAKTAPIGGFFSDVGQRLSSTAADVADRARQAKRNVEHTFSDEAWKDQS